MLETWVSFFAPTWIWLLDNPSVTIQLLGVIATLSAVVVALFNPHRILDRQFRKKQEESHAHMKSVAYALMTDVSITKAKASVINSEIKQFQDKRLPMNTDTVPVFFLEDPPLLAEVEMWVYKLPTDVVQQLCELRQAIGHYTGIYETLNRMDYDRIQDDTIYRNLSNFSKAVREKSIEVLSCLEDTFDFPEHYTNRPTG